MNKENYVVVIVALVLYSRDKPPQNPFPLKLKT